MPRHLRQRNKRPRSVWRLQRTSAATTAASWGTSRGSAPTRRSAMRAAAPSTPLRGVRTGTRLVRFAARPATRRRNAGLSSAHEIRSRAHGMGAWQPSARQARLCGIAAITCLVWGSRRVGGAWSMERREEGSTTPPMLAVCILRCGALCAERELDSRHTSARARYR